MKNACEAYLNARKELSILLVLKHPNIVPLLGISLYPLSLILSLAPLGALNEKLVEYHRAGARLTPTVLRSIIIQVRVDAFSKAFQYRTDFGMLFYVLAQKICRSVHEVGDVIVIDVVVFIPTRWHQR